MMKIFGHEMIPINNGWVVSIGGIRGSIYKSSKGYSSEYLEKYVRSGFETEEEARDHLEKKFRATLCDIAKYID